MPLESGSLTPQRRKKMKVKAEDIVFGIGLSIVAACSLGLAYLVLFN